MKVYFFMRRNPKNVSGMSYKVWKIERKGRKVTAWWGPAVVRRRRPVPASYLESKTWRFGSERAAVDFEEKRIRSKLDEGLRTPATN